MRRLFHQLRSMFRPSVRFMNLRSLDRAAGFDVCIIGSGPAGAALASDLVECGWRVLILESGPRRNRQKSNSVRKLQAYRSSGSMSYPFESSLCRGLGGASNLWTGGCPRLHPLDLDKNAYTPPGIAWPITYSDLDPYYERAERTLRVRQGGPLSQYHPPRRRDLPPGSGPDNSSLKSVLGEVGVFVDNSPVARAPGADDYFRISRDLLPGLSAEAHGPIICRGTATRLLADSTGNISGAEVQDLEGQQKSIQARVYVVACGGLETARLLLLSRSRFFPDGIGNSSGLVGKYFMEHLKITFQGIIPHRDFSGSGRCHQFYERFKRRGLGSVILGFAEERRGAEKVLRISADIEMFPSITNRATLSRDLQDCFGASGLDLCLDLSDYDLRTVREARALIQRIYADLGAVNVAVVKGDQGEFSWLYHHMGTCRMGENSNHSVTAPDLRVHDSPNLYLAGSSVFVTAGAANPTLTIVALSHRLADHLDARLR